MLSGGGGRFVCMPRRGGSAHVATIKTKGKGGVVYTSQLLRRSYRDAEGRVRHENLGNLSHLPGEVVDAIRAMLAGRRLVDLDEGFELCGSLPHGHVAAVLGVPRSLALARLLGGERALARRHLEPGAFVPYDLPARYVEGRCCPLPSLGSSRDGKKGTLQIN